MSDYTIVFDDQGFPVRLNHYAQLSGLTKNEVICTTAQAKQFNRYILLNGALKYVGVAPSTAYDLDMATGAWVLNPEKQKELDDAIYKASIPESVTMVQARLALLKIGLLDVVEAFMKTDRASREAKIFWDGTTVRRDDKIVKMMLGMLGLTEKQGDELFKDAATR